MVTVEAPARPQIRLHAGSFVNEPLVDFTKDENARRMRAAIEKARINKFELVEPSLEEIFIQTVGGSADA